MYEELFAAWRAFRRHKRPSTAIDEFAYHYEASLRELAEQIVDGTYRHGSYQTVVVREKKRRDLAVAGVRDRVVHRLVYDELIHVLNAGFDPDVWSCRPSKGLYGCLRRVEALLARYPDAYVWRMDITKFFDNVQHDVLIAGLARRRLRPHIFGLCEQIIASFHHHQPGVGIPIGNLTSQVFANIYLNEFDRYVRHTLKPLAYVRYGDDVVLWARDYQTAHRFHRNATQYLATVLGMNINPKNNIICQARRGLHFLGHVITQQYIVVDKHTTKATLQKSSSRSIASYKSLKLASVPKKQLDWQLLDELEEQGIV